MAKKRTSKVCRSAGWSLKTERTSEAGRSLVGCRADMRAKKARKAVANSLPARDSKGRFVSKRKAAANRRRRRAARY